MNTPKLHFTLLAFGGLCLSFSAGFAVTPKSDCVCPGPIHYYEELGCKPIYKNPGDCCPVRYDCSDWDKLPEDECLLNGHFYKDGEYMRAEDRNPGENCRCQGKFGWSCIEDLCDFRPATHVNETTVCYFKSDLRQQCGGTYTCIEKENRPTCLVDGTLYQDGERFTPSADPELRCACIEGYKGENVEPFCVKPAHTWCSNVVRRTFSIRDKCFPIYETSQNLRTSCNFRFRCPSDDDFIINWNIDDSQDPDMTCKFGRLTMAVGGKLNSKDSDTECTCEVPPIATCRGK